MKKRILSPALACLCFLLLPALAAAGPAVTISSVQVQPGALSTRLIMETDGPLVIQKAFYLPESPLTLALDVSTARTSQAPAVPASGASLIRDIQVQKSGEQDLRFLLRLSERVPYRVISEQGRTVVELNAIQRSNGRYLIDAETQSRLDQHADGEIFLSHLAYSASADKIAVRARMTGQAVAQVFALENPTRLVVDLFDTLLSAGAQSLPLNEPASAVQRVRVAQFQIADPRPITRMVFDLKEAGPYTLETRDSEVVVSFSAASGTAVNTAAPTAAAGPPAPADMPAKSAPKADPPPAPKPQATPTPPPVRESPPVVQEKKTTVISESQEDVFKPRTISAEQEVYSGEILSLRVKDADLKDVALYLADQAGLNIVFDPEVRGTVTCDLREVPWDQILDLVLKQNKMGKVIEGNVLRIAPVSVLTREEDEQRRMRESRELAGPLTVKTYTLSYSKARDVATLLQNKISTRGEIIVDERTNTLLISEVRDKLDLLERLIGVVDTPTPQVSIEARIVEATATFVRNLGIQWGFRGIADPFYGNATSVQFPNKVLVDGALIPQGIVTKGIGGPLGGYGINLPAPAFNTALGFSFANVLDTFRLDVALSALETGGDGKIVSLPKITTQNNLQAEIIQGRQIPVQTVANFTVTTRYVNAALELRATPQITAEGTVIMLLEIQNNAADFANLVNGIPPITTQSAKTTVMVPDGGTTVIGGIYRTEDSVTRERVPFLHQIPILGSAFKNFAKTKQSRELLIFITPRIVK
ncbi:MAG: type IV pilus secretin PilQ [Candidatus Aminicenantes bacterium]|nr:type IV pilus secretin PilQ [Candidatus Aminicenantes bacterium]